MKLLPEYSLIKRMLFLWTVYMVYGCVTIHNDQYDTLSVTQDTIAPNIRYFDENDKEISESMFNRVRSTGIMLDIPGDSIHHRKLTFREMEGTINDRKGLQLLLENATNIKLDSGKPIVVIYYPGADSCNSTGTTDSRYIKKWYQKLEDRLYEKAQVKPLYIYKDYDGLQKFHGILQWNKDPEGVIERLFFKHHYPCYSFVVISKDGDFISYFGEFGKGSVWKATERLME